MNILITLSLLLALRLPMNIDEERWLKMYVRQTVNWQEEVIPKIRAITEVWKAEQARKSNIRKRAKEIYYRRRSFGIQGTAEDDWLQAEREINRIHYFYVIRSNL